MLFFVALFFVLHSFYIMSMSFYASKKYAQQHGLSLAEVLQLYSNNKEHFFKNILFHLRYFPVSKAQDLVEFKIIYALFRGKKRSNLEQITENCNITTYISMSHNFYICMLF